MQEVFISSYFDINDYTTPIHYFLDDSYICFEEGRSIIYTTYYNKNLLKLSDQFFSLFTEPIQDYFYSLSKLTSFTTDANEGPGEGVYFQQEIKLDKEYDIYERSVYTITGVLQDVGGFYNSLFFIGLVIFSKTQTALFLSSLFSRIYQVECKEEMTKTPKEVENDLKDSHKFSD